MSKRNQREIALRGKPWLTTPGALTSGHDAADSRAARVYMWAIRRVLILVRDEAKSARKAGKGGGSD